MKAIIFDTETSGTNADINAILQLSYQIVDTATWQVLKEADHYFEWPTDGLVVEMGAIEVNGLTEEVIAEKQARQRAAGIPILNRHDAICEFLDDLAECDVCVAHNGKFDQKFIVATAKRENIIGLHEDGTAPSYWPRMADTMMDTVQLCKLPPKKPNPRYPNSYKWPRLYELADFLEIDYSDLNLHDSSADVELTKRCFRELCESMFYRF